MMTPERFWRRVEPVGECWEWIGTRGRHGYGRVGFRGRVDYAHRVAWVYTKGAIPTGLCVLHICDNPPCVRPEHLFVGTQRDNGRDKAIKGRAARNPSRRKLTREAVERIRQRVLLDGASQASVAREFGLHQTTVNQIVTGRRWSRL